MTFVGITALLISIVSVMFAFPNRTRDRYPLAFLLLVFHVAASVVYYIYVQSHDADTKFYYLDPLGLSRGPSAFGTVFVIQLVQSMRASFGGSYFDYFLAFQSVGLIGVVILSRIIAEVQATSQLPPTKWAIWILFLPSLHFWTSAIGKDAPLMFASSLAAWSLLRLSSRWFWFGVGITVMLLFRPHIALVAMLSLAISLFMDNRHNPLPRIVFLSIALLSSVYLVGATESTLNFNPADPNSVADFIVSKQNTFEMVGGGTAVHGGFIVRLLSLLFRPLFFDANGAFSIISSLENVLFIYGFVILIRNFPQIWKNFRAGIYSRYAFVFTFVLTISLAVLYYNVGLGLRQRVMVYPTLLPLFVLAWSVSAARKRHSGFRSSRPAERAASYELAGEHDGPVGNAPARPRVGLHPRQAPD